MYSKYHNNKFASRIIVDGENIEEVVENDDGEKEKIYKMLKQKNGEIVKLIPKEEMQRYNEKMNAEELSKIQSNIKAKILKYNEEMLEREALELDEVTEETEDQTDEQEEWDVKSILSTRTNTDNHPGIIKGIVKPKKNKIIIDPKTNAPVLETDKEQPSGITKKEKQGPYQEEIVSESDEDDIDETEIKNLETMTEEERKKYLKKMNKKQVKKEKKERRQQKKQMKKEFSKQHQRYIKSNTVKQGEIRPGVSVKKL